MPSGIIELDHIRTNELKNAGYKVLRFWENIKNSISFTKESVKKLIEKENLQNKEGLF